MKKLLLISVLFAFVGISCSKKDDPAPNPLLGTWKIVSTVKTGCTNSSDNGTTTCTDTVCETLSFTATQITDVYSGVTVSFPYTMSGSTITITITSSAGTTTQAFQFVVSGSSLTLTQTEAAADGNCTSVTSLTKQ